MQYKIVYDKPCRIRLRMSQGAFTAPQGYEIERLLMLQIGVVSAEASFVNGGILVYYKHGFRNAVLSLIDGLDRNKLADAPEQDGNRVREIEDTFSRAVVVTVCKHFAQKLLLPPPIRAILTFRRA